MAKSKSAKSLKIQKRVPHDNLVWFPPFRKAQYGSMAYRGYIPRKTTVWECVLIRQSWSKSRDSKRRGVADGWKYQCTFPGKFSKNTRQSSTGLWYIEGTFHVTTVWECVLIKQSWSKSRDSKRRGVADGRWHHSALFTKEYNTMNQN